LSRAVAERQAFAVTLIDSHAHLTFDVLHDDLDAVLARAAEAEVEQIVTIGTNVEDSRRAVELADSWPQISAVVGIHPHEAAKVGPSDLDALRDLINEPSVVGIGELGLDYHYDFADRDTQRTLFEAQLRLAAEHDFPLVIHCREAVDDAIACLTAAGFDNRRAVFHCFTGTRDEADRIAEYGWRISFTGIVTFRKSTELQAIAKDYPADRLMLETDCPYLSPEPVRKIRPNEPALIRHTAQFLADLRGESLADLAAQTTANARAFFGLT
jgi:TatD DNase family protein